MSVITRHLFAVEFKHFFLCNIHRVISCFLSSLRFVLGPRMWYLLGTLSRGCSIECIFFWCLGEIFYRCFLGLFNV